MSEETKRSINQVNRLIKSLIEHETTGFPFWVGGYVSRHYVSDFGHEYFDLTDEDFSISCMLRNTVRGTLSFEIANGMDIEVFGTLQVYERQARVQIQVEEVRLISANGFVLDQTVQQQLAEKGLWPPVKKPLPAEIRQIGLVTSKRSEALKDFEDTYRSERGGAALKVADVLLVGQQAPQQIAGAIERYNHQHQVDVIVLTRGGGRSTELSVFNDLLVAEAICRSQIPVVTGIGHQRDSTLADHVADVTTITPTAAAVELARRTRPQQDTLAAETTARPATSNQALFISVAIIIAAIIIALVLLSQGS